MIQRIQTVYLFIALILLVLMFFIPYAELLASNEKIYYLYFDGIKILDAENHKTVYSAIPLFFLIFFITMICFISIFLFKKRILQIRLCIFNILLMLGMEGLIFFYAFNAKGKLDAIIHFNFPVVLLAFSVILTYLAFRGIKKDEKLIRSYDRIR